MFNIIKFSLVLCQTTVDSFTKWMNEMCREHIDISTVLRIERCMLTREVKKVRRSSSADAASVPRPGLGAEKAAARLNCVCGSFRRVLRC